MTVYFFPRLIRQYNGWIIYIFLSILCMYSRPLGSFQWIFVIVICVCFLFYKTALHLLWPANTDLLFCLYQQRILNIYSGPALPEWMNRRHRYITYGGTVQGAAPIFFYKYTIICYYFCWCYTSNTTCTTKLFHTV